MHLPEPIDHGSPFCEEEIAEIKQLFPELDDRELQKFMVALDSSIDKILDSYFGLDEMQKLSYN